MAKRRRKGEVAVNSTCLRTVRNDPESKTLDVQFRKSGARYRYFGVSERKTENLKAAESVGRHFVRNIRNKHEYERLTQGDASRRRKGKR